MSAGGGVGADTEVHIRKLDTDSKLHWRLLASVDVAAGADAIWAVLTDYAALGNVVPVISVSEEVPRGGGGGRRGAAAAAAATPPGLRRVRQVAAKRLPYVQLRTEVVLDVLEKPGRAPGDVWELQFKQHRSDFDVLQVCTPPPPPFLCPGPGVSAAVTRMWCMCHPTPVHSQSI